MPSRTVDKNRDRISLALGAAAVLLGAWACAKVAGFYVQRGLMQSVLTVEKRQRDPNGLKDSLGAAKKTADTLKQNNLFVKTPPKTNPVRQVDGILGDEAFISGKWYKVGDKIADAKIVAIGATKVEIEWDGKKTSFAPMAAASAGPPTPPPTAGPPKPEAARSAPKPPEVKAAKAEAPAVEDDPLAWMGIKLSAKARAKLLEEWNKASPEDKEKGKQMWNSLPDDQKQQYVQMMENM
jgi:hypothetical protein